MNGVVRDISREKGFGFIIGEDGREYFVHRSAIKNARLSDMGRGQEVIFEESEGPKGLRAEDVYVQDLAIEGETD